MFYNVYYNAINLQCNWHPIFFSDMRITAMEHFFYSLYLHVVTPISRTHFSNPRNPESVNLKIAVFILYYTCTVLWPYNTASFIIFQCSDSLVQDYVYVYLLYIPRPFPSFAGGLPRPGGPGGTNTLASRPSHLLGKQHRGDSGHLSPRSLNVPDL